MDVTVWNVQDPEILCANLKLPIKQFVRRLSPNIKYKAEHTLLPQQY